MAIINFDSLLTFVGTFGDLDVSGRLRAFGDLSFTSVDMFLHFGVRFLWMRETLLSVAVDSILAPLLHANMIYSCTGVLLRRSSGFETSVRPSLRVW